MYTETVNSSDNKRLALTKHLRQSLVIVQRKDRGPRPEAPEITQHKSGHVHLPQEGVCCFHPILRESVT